ncbi:MAG: hypothetical protein HY921_01135 [Elusimicrobia bacterium]|nr:hypothetical protein [Elusimicrobiota bacterium]
MIMADLGEWLESARNEARIINSTIRERGLNRFLRPILFGGIIVYICYSMVYQKPGRQLAGLNKKIEASRATSQYADNYKTLRDRLGEVRALLPTVKERDRWLTGAILDSMRSGNILADSILPPDEVEQSGLVFQKVSVSLELKFPDLVAWLSRMEDAKPLMHIASFDLSKKADRPGRNGVNCTIATIIPAQGGAR